MIKYGKLSQAAISCVSYLAVCHQQKRGKVSSLEVSEARGISKPLVAKLLTQLSQAGLVDGAPGPHGGYELSKPPGQITLNDVVSCFEKVIDRVSCPFGDHWCGNNDPCPLHDELVRMADQYENFLNTTTLKVFAEHKGGPPMCRTQPQK